jgi:hypothetical protein
MGFGFLGATLLLTIFAWLTARGAERELAAPVQVDADGDGTRHYFVARVATWLGMLSSLVVLALHLPTWMLSPCVS